MKIFKTMNFVPDNGFSQPAKLNFLKQTTLSRVGLPLLLLSSINYTSLYAEDTEYCGKPESAYSSVIKGTESNDILIGTSRRDLILGLGGDDVIKGGRGGDCILGGDGNDTLWGGRGADEIYGGAGNDRIRGFKGKNKLYGGSGDDIITSGRNNDLIYGNDGNDDLRGGAGADKIIAGAGIDKLKAGGRQTKHDVLFGDQDDLCAYQYNHYEPCKFVLPPDPGEAGKATLEGIDSDDDGVRDDIQRYIAIEYQDSEKIRRALTDKAKADQEFLLNADDKDKVLEADKKSSKAQQCSWYIDPETAIIRHRKLKAELLNTEERIRAWIKADSHLGGMTFRVPLPEERKAMCEFNPDQLAN